MSLPLDPSTGLAAALQSDDRQRAGRERSPPDDGFWRDVFGQAQAVSQHGRATEPTSAREPATRPGRPADALRAPAAAALAGVAQPAAQPAWAVLPQRSADRVVASPARPGSGLPTGVAVVPQAEAGADADEPVARGMAVLRGPRPAEFAATVVLAEDGERRVYLRGALDERQALELAARAAAAQGGAADAVSVRLNGRLLYRTETAATHAAAPGIHTLPGRAYADQARAAAPDHTDHPDQE